jgi:3'(2'), 5'-bisphosphate nucleotidase
VASVSVSVPVAQARLLAELTTAVARAAAAILAIPPTALAPREKPDQSPVTAADEAAEAVILEHLARLLPGVPVVSEEAAARTDPPAPPSTFVLVDPLDGTREFLAGRPEFTVNVALVAEWKPIIGVVAAPASRRLWRGVVGQGAERLVLVAEGEPAALEPTVIRTRPAPADGLVAAVSRSHPDAGTESFLAVLPVTKRIRLGSSAKFCLVAEGSADLYPRFSPTSEWDIAAGHAVLAAAGGTVTTPDGGPIQYGRAQQRFRVPGFMAWGDGGAARRYHP